MIVVNPPKNIAYLRLAILILSFVMIIGFVAITPMLMIPVLISMALFFILLPLVNFFERQNIPRTLGAIIACAVFFLPTIYFSLYGAVSLSNQATKLEQQIPKYVSGIRQKLLSYEQKAKVRFSFLKDVELSKSVIDWSSRYSVDFLAKSPAFLSTILWSIILVPLLTIFLLRDSNVLMRWTLSMTPNRYFEVIYNVSNQVSNKLGSYINAKIFEAFLVGLLTFCGLYMIDFPYYFLISIIAGITNIIPYFGPVLGIIPSLIIAGFDPQAQNNFIPMLFIFLAVNALDMLVIFPLLVSKVIDLHPIVVLFCVVIGGHLAGPIGLLVAIPIAAIFKILAYEVLES